LKPPLNNRRSLRYHVQGLLGSFKLEIQADLLNLSLFGLSVRTPVALGPSKQVMCELGEEPDTVSVQGGVVWCRPANQARGAEAAQAGYFDLGVRFNEDLLNKAEGLLRFLDNSTIVKLTKGVYGRFELDYQIPIKLRHRHELKVKEISSSGIMAETDVPLSPENRIDLELPLKDRRFISRARVVWVREDGDDGEPQRLGMEFYEPTQKQSELLRGFIREALEH